MIDSIYNFFIPSEYKQHPEDYRQAKTSVLFYLFNALGLILNSYSGFQINFMPFTYANWLYAVISISLAFCVRWGVSLRLCAAILASIGFFYVGFVIYNTGGIQSATIFGLLFVPLYYLFLSNNLKYSIAWMVTSLVCLVGFYLYEIYVAELPISIDTTNIDWFEFTVLFAECSTVFVLVSIFHIQKDKAVNELIGINQNLKKTQDQLIQSEKLASLGELTAGISHEIQNPLNFVNNFAEVTSELTEELAEESGKTVEKRDWDLERELLDDIRENLIKIGHHGSRASSIVQGMLEHSRARTDKKEPTDISTLADEYLRLAYHGLRAKDRAFNANFKTDFESGIPTILTFKQDIGRVLLNLINNAFQAVAEKQKKITDENVSFNPEVIVKVFRRQEVVIITVSDNGMGIPDNIKEKILQPFYTTKPTGQGTGLGLSLAYDIVVKGHNGTLTFESQHTVGTTFSISLPI
jgi:signal transduction histidine kinase